MGASKSGTMARVSDEDDAAVDAANLQAFGAGLRRVRESLEIGRPALAQAAGVSESTIVNCERGASVRSHVLMRIAQALGFQSLGGLIVAIEGGVTPDVDAAKALAKSMLLEMAGQLDAPTPKKRRPSKK
jgi:DNA-binding XRE family transcriptional regulator